MGNGRCMCTNLSKSTELNMLDNLENNYYELDFNKTETYNKLEEYSNKFLSGWFKQFNCN